MSAPRWALKTTSNSCPTLGAVFDNLFMPLRIRFLIVKIGRKLKFLADTSALSLLTHYEIVPNSMVFKNIGRMDLRQKFRSADINKSE